MLYLAGFDLLLIVQPDNIELVTAANLGGEYHLVPILDNLRLDVVHHLRELGGTWRNKFMLYCYVTVFSK